VQVQLCMLSVYMLCINRIFEIFKHTKGVTFFTKLSTALTFSSVWALRGLQLPGRLSTAPVSRNFFNSLLTPFFVQLFSWNSSVNLFAVYFFQILTFYQNLVFVAQYHVDCWQTLHWRLLWRISGATNWFSKVNQYKNSDLENVICNQYGERLAILKLKV